MLLFQFQCEWHNILFNVYVLISSMKYWALMTFRLGLRKNERIHAFQNCASKLMNISASQFNGTQCKENCQQLKKTNLKS